MHVVNQQEKDTTKTKEKAATSSRPAAAAVDLQKQAIDNQENILEVLRSIDRRLETLVTAVQKHFTQTWAFL